jgi:hypothetical protein
LTGRNPIVFQPPKSRHSGGELVLRPQFESYITGKHEDSPYINEMFITNPPVDSVRVNIGGTHGQAPCPKPLRERTHMRDAYAAPEMRCGHDILNLVVRKVGGIKVTNLVNGIKQAMKEMKGTTIVNTLVMLGSGWQVVSEETQENKGSA